MSRSQGKRGRFAGANGFASGASAFGGFSSSSGGSGLSYLTEPPNLSTISDANVGVSFKNLLKKDATTKSKALEDLVAYVKAHPHDQGGGVEDPILDAWVGAPVAVPSPNDAWTSGSLTILHVTGPGIPTYRDRQRAPCPRTRPHITIRVDALRSKAHGEEGSQGGRRLVSRTLR